MTNVLTMVMLSLKYSFNTLILITYSSNGVTEVRYHSSSSPPSPSPALKRARYPLAMQTTFALFIYHWWNDQIFPLACRWTLTNEDKLKFVIYDKLPSKQYLHVSQKKYFCPYHIFNLKNNFAEFMSIKSATITRHGPFLSFLPWWAITLGVHQYCLLPAPAQ